MTVPNKYSLIVFLSIVALILSACGAQSSQGVIATSVALTIQAEHTQEAQSTPTAAPAAALTMPAVASLPALPGTPAGATKAPPTAPTGTGGQLCTADATFVSETIPDGTITSPGAVFTKTWRILNSGTCPWNSTWQFVYTTGDLMGAAMYYNLPGIIMPGETLSMPVVLTAPADSGSYRGYWKIKSPWGALIGDSSGNAFWVDIVVGSGTPANNKTETAYGITNVSYDLSYTCTSANQFDTVTATISSNGPVTAKFSWLQSDGNNDASNTISFSAAGTKTVTREWHWGVAASRNPRWVSITITSPSYQEYPKLTMETVCWP